MKTLIALAGIAALSVAGVAEMRPQSAKPQAKQEEARTAADIERAARSAQPVPPAPKQPGGFPAEPAFHYFASDAPLTCTVIVNGASTGSFQFVKNTNRTVDGKFWIGPPGLEWWEGSVSVGSKGLHPVRLIHYTSKPENSKLPYGSLCVTVSGNSFPPTTAVYSSPMTLVPTVTASADMSLVYAGFVNGAPVRFVFN